MGALGEAKLRQLLQQLLTLVQEIFCKRLSWLCFAVNFNASNARR